MKIHLIAIGGSAMHNLAIALKQKRNKVTGSDDKIFSPSKERLEKQNLLPEKTGWDPSKITKDCLNVSSTNWPKIKPMIIGTKIGVKRIVAIRATIKSDTLLIKLYILHFLI